MPKESQTPCSVGSAKHEGNAMAAVEASGKTVEEAIENALVELDADRDEVEVEVLQEPKSGILGVGGAQAVVRVHLIGEEPDETAGESAPLAEGEEGELIEDEAEM